MSPRAMAISKIGSLLEKQRRADKARAQCAVIYSCASIFFLISLLILSAWLTMDIHWIAVTIELFVTLTFFVIARHYWKTARRLREISRNLDKLSVADNASVSSSPWWKRRAL